MWCENICTYIRMFGIRRVVIERWRWCFGHNWCESCSCAFFFVSAPPFRIPGPNQIIFFLSLVKSLFYFFDFILSLSRLLVGWQVASYGPTNEFDIGNNKLSLECLIKYVFINSSILFYALPRRFVEQNSTRVQHAPAHTRAQLTYTDTHIYGIRIHIYVMCVMCACIRIGTAYFIMHVILLIFLPSIRCIHFDGNREREWDEGERRGKRMGGGGGRPKVAQPNENSILFVSLFPFRLRVCAHVNVSFAHIRRIEYASMRSHWRIESNDGKMESTQTDVRLCFFHRLIFHGGWAHVKQKKSFRIFYLMGVFAHSCVRPSAMRKLNRALLTSNCNSATIQSIFVFFFASAFQLFTSI